MNNSLFSSFRFWTKRKMYCFYDDVCVFLCLCTRLWLEKNLGTSTSREVSNFKLDRVDALRRSFFLTKYLLEKTEKETEKKSENVRQNDFRQTQFRSFAITQNILIVVTWNLHQTLIVVIHRCGVHFKSF